MVENLVDNFNDDKIGLIVFAGDAFVQLPITSDYVSAKMFLESIDPSMMASQGTDAAAAINMAVNSFTHDEGVGKAIILITDGEDHEGGALEAATNAKEKGMRVYVLGVGSPKGAPIPIPGTNKFETEPKEADIPYAITPIEYKLNINAKMEFATFFKNPSATKTTILDKTYLNVYTINYAMQLVSIEKVDIYDEGSTDSILNVLGIEFRGVGDINVKVTVNSITTEYTVQSGERLIFENYGVYTISIQDSMGTTTTAEFSYLKPTSVSAIILIVLVGVIVLAIVLFILAARGKVSTR
jgi:hypothetical protein